MSFTIVFNTLADAYRALMLSARGQKVLLRVPEGLPALHGNVIVCGFVSDTIFAGQGGSSVGYDRLLQSCELLCSMMPNTIYAERAFAVQDRNIVRDFSNFFRGRQYRHIYESSRPPQFAGCSLDGGKVLKRAPAYRLNYSRHLVSVLRTIHGLGGTVELTHQDPDAGSTAQRLAIYTMPNAKAPAPANTLYLQGGVWLYNRCGCSYMAVEPHVENPLQIVGQCLDGCQLSDADLSMVATVPWGGPDSPLEAWDAVMQEYPDIRNIQMDGCGFEFSPSSPDVLGYADYCFDMVKRMGIDVNIFRNAVYDYGTHIEDIVNDTYDLYPQYHSGPMAFEAAVQRWSGSELRF